MFSGARPNPLNISAEADVARNFLPNEIKCVSGTPHIGAASGDSVFAFGRVVLSFTARRRLPHAAFISEYSQATRFRQCHRRGQRQEARQRTTWQERYFSV